jgi:hypothetical protein
MERVGVTAGLGMAIVGLMMTLTSVELAVVTDHPLPIPFRLSRVGSTNRMMSGSCRASMLADQRAG